MHILLQRSYGFFYQVFSFFLVVFLDFLVDMLEFLLSDLAASNSSVICQESGTPHIRVRNEYNRIELYPYADHEVRTSCIVMIDLYTIDNCPTFVRQRDPW